MRAIITPHTFSGTVRVPASKSHTIRRLLIASLTDGVSRIERPLDSLDARSCLAVCRALGVDILEKIDETGVPEHWSVRGITRSGNSFSFGYAAHERVFDVGNSGTTLFLALAIAALGSTPCTFTGDEQIRRRSAANLLSALTALGVTVLSAKNGCAPITVRGPWKGGTCSIECPTSQYLSALLLAAPLASAGCVTDIDVPLLNEKPYIDMTLSYLDTHGVPYEKNADFSHFRVPGGAVYKPMNGIVPADFSSAAFPAATALISGGSVTLIGLDPHDTQGDKAFFDMITQMGASVAWSASSSGGWEVTISGKGRGERLCAGSFDLNAVPDLLPVMAVLAAFAEGETHLTNVAHARIKETDRITVMAQELSTLGVQCAEKPDGLIIRGGAPSGGAVDGHGDHRIVMAFAAAGLGTVDDLEIRGAEAADVTYPGFLNLLEARFM
ncbi:MAG: 3-phosphoshikimate 1-carboxyvinyltransferase [Treponema sp.]|jgi:3-phosphoshikimate 1-carboxyvinyltransferase|nr:3-phosphoshikimate 1-carboxyvinyltransferase [Treponema sp.]